MCCEIPHTGRMVNHRSLYWNLFKSWKADRNSTCRTGGKISGAIHLSSLAVHLPLPSSGHSEVNHQPWKATGTEPEKSWFSKWGFRQSSMQCVCVFGCGCGYIKVSVCWQLPRGVAKRSLCTILRTGSKTSECRDFKWPELWQQETCGYLDWFLHHYVWHMWRSLLISVQICIQSFGAVYPPFTCLPSKKL